MTDLPTPDAAGTKNRAFWLVAGLLAVAGAVAWSMRGFPPENSPPAATSEA